MIEIITNPFVVVLLSGIGFIAGWHIGKYFKHKKQVKLDNIYGRMYTCGRVWDKK